MNNEIQTYTNEQTRYSNAIISTLEIITINSREAVDEANVFLKEVKARAKDLEEKERSITKPMNDALKATRDLFRQPKELLARAEMLLKGGIARYLDAQRVVQVQAVQAASQAFAAGDTAGGRTAIETAAAVNVASPQGLSVRKQWDFEILQPGLVPRELCTPDPTKIRTALKLVDVNGPPPNIPGVRAFVRDVVSSRG